MQIHMTQFEAKIDRKKEHCVLSMWIFQCRCHPPIYNLLFVSSTQLFPSSACWTAIALHLKPLYSWIKSKQWVATAGQTQTVHHLELNPSQTKLAERLQSGAKWQTFFPMSSSAHSSTPPWFFQTRSSELSSNNWRLFKPAVQNFCLSPGCESNYKRCPRAYDATGSDKLLVAVAWSLLHHPPLPVLLYKTSLC